jgi:hypothetical protein
LAVSNEPAIAVIVRPQPPVVVGPGKFSDALYVLLEREADYEIVTTGPMINVARSVTACAIFTAHRSDS